MPCGTLRDGGAAEIDGYRMVDHIMSLGTYLQNDGSTIASLEHRLECAEKCFWKYAKSFRGKGSIAAKMRAWSAAPSASAVYGSCSWHLCKHVLLLFRCLRQRLRRRYNRCDAIGLPSLRNAGGAPHRPLGCGTPMRMPAARGAACS